MSAWVYQDPKQVKKVGEKAASWYVGWVDPEGKKRCKSCGPGREGERAAEKLCKKREAELLTGTYQSATKKAWADYRQEYEAKILAGMDGPTRDAYKYALDHFERIIKPARLQAVTTRTFADYTARRRAEQGAKPGTLVSPATVNKELRHLRAVLRKAHKWGYLTKLPEFEFLREPRKLPTYVTPEHFALIYEACEKARLPGGLAYAAADWWRGLLVTGYMTGWRVGQMLALKRDDLDLDGGTAVTRAKDNKGRRDDKVPLHPVVVEHLRVLAGFSPLVFPWLYNRRTLFTEFERIQKAAGIRLTGPKDHYGFHDLRRAFATMNADKLTPDALQALMQHKDYQTTQRYINLARQLNPAVAGLYVPELPKVKKA